MIRLLASLVGGVALGAVLVGGTSGQERSSSPLPDTFRIAAFSSPLSTHPETVGWLPLAFGDDKGTTAYRVGQEGGRTCLMAEAQASSSGLLKLVDVDPGSFPLLRWSWWVRGPIQAGDLTKKEGDDFAARIFVNFRFDPSGAGLLTRLRHSLAGKRFGGEAPGRSLVYVWGNRAPIGAVAPSAYTDEAVQFVIRSGEVGAGQWWTEERDLLRDFREAFGKAPPSIVSIAVMTDADDTGGEALACYGDILLLSR